MTLPRTAAEVLSGHVTLEVRCIDRMMLTFRQPRLQYGQGIHGFFCQHRGNRFVHRHAPAGPGPVREGAEQGPGALISRDARVPRGADQALATVSWQTVMIMTSQA